MPSRRNGPTSSSSTSTSSRTTPATCSGALRASGIPVALVTGSVDLDDLQDTADAVLRKPFEPRMLVDTARRLARVGA